MGSLIQTWLWITLPLTQKIRALGLQEAGRGWAVVGQVKELVVGISHQTAPCPGSLGPEGVRREEGERSASVYLPRLLFTPLD